MTEITRNDYTALQCEFMNLAVSSDTIDAVDLAVTMTNTYGEFSAVADAIFNASWAARNVKAHEARKALVELYNAICAEDTEQVVA